MNKSDYLENLKTVVSQVLQAEKHLKNSYRRCQHIGLKGPHSEDHLIEFEALTGRFARLTDMVIHKLFRAVDIVELVEGGTLIDVINRAEKRGLVDSSVEARVLKDLRNDIAHEYLTEKLTRLHEEVYNAVPKLLTIISNTITYSKKYTQTT